jgi:hypothetical protein
LVTGGRGLALAATVVCLTILLANPPTPTELPGIVRDDFEYVPQGTSEQQVIGSDRHTRLFRLARNCAATREASAWLPARAVRGLN